MKATHKHICGPVLFFFKTNSIFETYPKIYVKCIFLAAWEGTERERERRTYARRDETSKNRMGYNKF